MNERTKREINELSTIYGRSKSDKDLSRLCFFLIKSLYAGSVNRREYLSEVYILGKDFKAKTDDLAKYYAEHNLDLNEQAYAVERAAIEAGLEGVKE